ncbi:hypothetical protein [Microtetraspora sp. NBRC 16547]|uniref:hypothetical protein n=1 Tax=Microtetraspora sp. NBRC 16547 TaxID=3030993 RepID=UPI0024A53ED0|nr:hypothetical protein [Microtetraspora sp. NBRC 16547]GLW98653.1 hypothetical protein Misp02_27400 [Microtetraspora sp. NBRC 16547]
MLLEVRRLLRSPVPWGAAALCLGLRLVATWEWLPDMSVEPTSTSGAMLLLAAAMMLTANLATSRDVRGGMPETLGALPGRAAERTTAATLAAVVVGAAIALPVMIGYLLARLAMGPVAGVFDPYEALGGVLAVPFAAALGAMLGRWVPWLVAVPATAFLIGAFTWLNGNQSGYGGWFLPVVLFHGPDWPQRPSALHVVYLLAAIALFATLALLRHGVRPVRLVAALAAAAVAVPVGAAATAAAPREEINYRFEAVQKDPTALLGHMDARVRERYFGPDARRCEKHGTVTYCAFRDYVAWIPSWVSAVDPVVRALPPAERDRFPVVRQFTDTWWPADDDEERKIRTFMMWGRAGAEDTHRAVLASGVVRSVAGLRPPAEGCDARGQSRVIVALWLLGQAVPLTPPEDREIQIGSSLFTRDQSPLGMVRYGAAELGYARRLLAMPGARERIWTNWDALLNPGTTVEQALPLLGLRPEFAAEPEKGQPCS